MNRFEVGETYQARSACDHDTVFEWTVLSRTAKYMTLDEKGSRAPIRVGIKTHEAAYEWAMPYGSYSMAPTIQAKGRET